MKIQPNDFKIRASASGDLMKNDRSGKAMGETSKSYCKQWATEKLFNRTKEITTKYTTKGTLQEDLSIDLIEGVLDIGMMLPNRGSDGKQEEFENEFMTGHPDVLMKDPVIDVKSSWDVFTFPYFAKTVPAKHVMYEWQLQVYMALTKRKKAILAYCLVDTPQHLIEREARYYCADLGYDELDAEIYDQFEKRMTYGDIDPELRVKTFEIERDDAKIKAIEDRVKLAREYIKTLI